MSDGNNRFQNNPNQKPPNVLNEFALRLTGEKIGQQKRDPSLMLNVKRDGKSGPWCVQFEVRTNVENDKDYGKITFMLDLPTAFMVLDLIMKYADEAAANPSEGDFAKIELASRRFMRSQNAMSKEPMNDGTIAVGRTSTGQIFIGVQSWDPDRPKCKFILRPVVDFRRAVKLYKKDGTAWEDGPLSQLYARAWATGLTKLLSQLYVSEFTPAPPREQQGGGGGQGGYGGNQGGNNNRGGGGYGGGGNSGGSAGGGGWSDDDIPM